MPLLESSPLAALEPAERLKLRSRLTVGLARAYLNLGVMGAQGHRFAQAAQMFEISAKVDPDFPQVQSSLGVAYFNAGQFDKAIVPLGRAIETTPDPELKRLLAMAWLNTERYDKAAELLELDPERASGTRPSSSRTASPSSRGAAPRRRSGFSPASSRSTPTPPS